MGKNNKAQKNHSKKKTNAAPIHSLSEGERSRLRINFLFELSDYYIHITPADAGLTSFNLENHLNIIDLDHKNNYEERVDSNRNNQLMNIFNAINKYNTPNEANDAVKQEADILGKSVIEHLLNPSMLGSSDLTIEQELDKLTMLITEAEGSIYELGDLKYKYNILLISRLINSLASFDVDPRLIILNRLVCLFLNPLDLKRVISLVTEEQWKYIKTSSKYLPIYYIIHDGKKLINLLRAVSSNSDEHIDIMLELAVIFGNIDFVKYVLATKMSKRINPTLYESLISNTIKAMTRGVLEICIEFIKPEIWNLYQEDDKVRIFNLIALKSGRITSLALIEGLFSNNLLNIEIIARALDNLEYIDQQNFLIQAISPFYRKLCMQAFKLGANNALKVKTFKFMIIATPDGYGVNIKQIDNDYHIDSILYADILRNCISEEYLIKVIRTFEPLHDRILTELLNFRSTEEEIVNKVFLSIMWTLKQFEKISQISFINIKYFELNAFIKKNKINNASTENSILGVKTLFKTLKQELAKIMQQKSLQSEIAEQKATLDKPAEVENKKNPAIENLDIAVEGASLEVNNNEDKQEIEQISSAKQPESLKAKKKDKKKQFITDIVVINELSEFAEQIVTLDKPDEDNNNAATESLHNNINNIANAISEIKLVEDRQISLPIAPTLGSFYQAQQAQQSIINNFHYVQQYQQPPVIYNHLYYEQSNQFQQQVYPIYARPISQQIPTTILETRYYVDQQTGQLVPVNVLIDMQTGNIISQNAVNQPTYASGGYGNGAPQYYHYSNEVQLQKVSYTIFQAKEYQDIKLSVKVLDNKPQAEIAIKEEYDEAVTEIQKLKEDQFANIHYEVLKNITQNNETSLVGNIHDDSYKPLIGYAAVNIPSDLIYADQLFIGELQMLAI